jgi:hypothetical protein
LSGVPQACDLEDTCLGQRASRRGLVRLLVHADTLGSRNERCTSQHSD